MNTEGQNKRVGIGEKISLFMTYAGNIPLMTLLSAYFLIYYTTVVGLDPKALATLFLISKVVDGISDPVMGYVLDRFPVTKLGKFRPMLILGTIICVINYILLWFGAVWSPVGKYVIVYVTYLLLGWTFDVMDISKNSLIPVMSTSSKERNKLTLAGALGNMAGAAVIGILGPIIVAEGTLQGYYVLIFGSMAMTLAFSIVGALGVKERVAFEGTEEENYTIKEMLSFLRYKPIWAVFVTTLVAGIGSQVSGGANAYFYTFILGDMKLMSGVTVIALLSSIAGTVAGPFLANSMGKKKTFLLSLVISIAATCIRLINIRSMTLIYISTVIGGIGGGILTPVITGVQADNTSYVQYRTGKRAEAAIASLTSFITKVAQGLGGAIPGYVLAACGFVTGAATQPESVHTGIILCVIILPIIFSMVGAVIFGTQYTLGKKEVEEIMIAVEAGNSGQNQKIG